MTDVDLSVIIPAHDEEAWIDRCLSALLAQEGETGRVEVLVVANACRDNTAPVAESYAPRAAARGWDLRVLNLAQGGKILALNAGDRAAQAASRALRLTSTGGPRFRRARGHRPRGAAHPVTRNRSIPRSGRGGCG